MSSSTEARPAMHLRSLSLIVVGALLLTSLASVTAQTAPPAPPSREGQPTPPPAKQRVPAEEQELKIVRWVCTDRLCGGCDGACSRSGHVAVSRHGHCACTPKAGGKLDEAIRKA